MEMYQIRYFLAVCGTLNFTRAAEACNVSQPALTRAVQKLEEELGGLLFRRERGLTHLTDLGRLMQPRLEQVLAQSAGVKSTAERFLNMAAAPLNVGIMCTVGPMRFVGFLARFREQHPGVELSLIEGVPQQLGESLREGRLDIAMMVPPDPPDERFDVQPLYGERFVVAFPPGHRFERMNAVRIVDMQGESYLTRLNCEYYDQLRGLRLSLGVDFVDAYRSEREDWIQTMVLAGMGVCFMPEYSPLLPGVQQRLIIEPEVQRQVCCVTVAGRRFSPAETSFLRAIRSYDWPESSQARRALGQPAAPGTSDGASRTARRSTR